MKLANPIEYFRASLRQNPERPWGRDLIREREYQKLLRIDPKAAEQYIKDYEAYRQRYRKVDEAVLRAQEKARQHRGEWKSGAPVEVVAYYVYLKEELEKEFPGVNFGRQIEAIRADTRDRFTTRMDESEYLHDHLEKQLKRKLGR